MQTKNIPLVIKKWGLLKIFAFSSFIAILTISTISGFMFFSFLEKSLFARETSISAEFIQSIASIHNPNAYFKGSTSLKDKDDGDLFFRHVIGIPQVFRATIYNMDYTIIWSHDTELIGQRLTDNKELIQAYSGINLFYKGEVGRSEKEEHGSFPKGMEFFVESYISVWNTEHSQVIGVVELYRSPTELFNMLSDGRILVIIISLLSGIVLYWLLYWIVSSAHHLIENQRERIKQASSRAVELNEQHLRKIGSELHDGAIQSIGFALLTLDAILISKHVDEPCPASCTNKKVVGKIKLALDSALIEIRSLSSGLIIPDLKDLSFNKAIHHVIKRHEEQTSTYVDKHISMLPDTLINANKICIYRLIQEGLNNAYKHGKGIKQKVTLITDEMQLILIISDEGPGMNHDDIIKFNSPEHLGLRGLRERVESLGGDFEIVYNDANKHGVKLIATLPF